MLSLTTYVVVVVNVNSVVDVVIVIVVVFVVDVIVVVVVVDVIVGGQKEDEDGKVGKWSSHRAVHEQVKEFVSF